MLKIETKPKPLPSDLITFLPYACNELSLKFALKITVVVEDEYVSMTNKTGTGENKKKKSEINVRKSMMMAPQSTSSVALSFRTEEDSVLGGQVVRMTCAQAGPARATVAVELDRNPAVPRQLLCVLHLCLPYNQQLTRFSARWTALEPGVLIQLGDSLPHSNISDVRLDNTSVLGCECCVLLDAGRLRRLSLARCQLGDEGCVAVAEALVFPRPGSRTLAALTLAGNAIGDAGALALAHALRSNRTLRLLDLADNQLRDDGALAILRTLAEFPLTDEEIQAGRAARMEHTLREAEAARYAEEMRRCSRTVRVVRRGAEEARERRRLARLPTMASVARMQREQGEEAAAAAARLARELTPLLDPFPPEETVRRGGSVHSQGNMALNCLNLAYNSLSVASVRALLASLQAQAEAGAGGLVRVVLVGNPLPALAPEYDAAAALMETALSAMTSANKPQPISKKKVASKK